MYTEESVNEVKSAAVAFEVIQEYIKLERKGTTWVGLCPFHSERTGSFKVSETKNIYKCFGCAKSGDALQFLIEYKQMSYPAALQLLAEKYNVKLVDEKDHVYVKPSWKNQTELNANVVKWFEKRAISQATLLRAQVTDGPEWMPGPNAVIHTIQFNYFRKGVLTNIKYRGKDKTFKLHKGSELIFCNLDSLIGKKVGYITEGEVDELTLIECGYWNDESGVVSVPNGATKDHNNLSYIDNCIKEIDHIKQWIICTDDDANGRKLREDIAVRLGKEKCKYITYKGKKDINEIHVAEGVQGVIDCCSNPQSFPIEGVFTIEDFDKPLEDMYHNGLDKGVDLQIPNFNLNIVKGYWTVLTGTPGHGKSEFLDYIVLNLVKYSQWKGAYYSPENRPTELHISKLARKLIGKDWEGSKRMSLEDLKFVKDYLNRRVWFIRPEKGFTLTSILEYIRMLLIAYGLDFFVIDAWNKLEHKETGIDYMGRSLDEIAAFCELHKVHGFIVAHPKKGVRTKDGKWEVPTLYDISGTADWNNKVDNGICINRNFFTGETTAYIQKVKFGHWGKVGHSTYKFHTPSLRYYPEGFPDFRNWITGELNTTEVKEEKVPQQMDVFYDVEDAPF